MGQQRLEDALRVFRRAQQLDPKLELSRLNEGIALLNLQRFSPARRLLRGIVERDPNHAKAWYNLGLLDRAQGQDVAALEDFRRAAKLAPADADTAYFLGAIYSQLHREQEAIAALQQALALDPFHASAEFALARAYLRVNETEEAKPHLARFQDLTRNKLGSVVGQAYGEQGPLSLAEPVKALLQSAPPAIPVRFAYVTIEAGLATTAKPAKPVSPNPFDSGACFLDFDGDGLPDLLLGDNGPQGGLTLLRNLGRGRFADVTRPAGFDPSAHAIGCAAADYDNDGWTDVALSFEDHLALFHNQHNGTFKDVTETSGVRATHAPFGLAWIDYDHDGDVDLYVSGNPVTGSAGKVSNSQLWRNNGNGTFTEWTEQTGLGGGPGFSVVATDFNNDRAIDLLVATDGEPPRMMVNPREGKFKPVEPWSQPVEPVVGVAALDFNKDGWMDLAFTHRSAPGLTLWRNVEGKRFEPVSLPDMHWTRAWGVAAFDYDNDGWIDLVAVGETADGRGEIRLLRNIGANGFTDVTAQVGLDKIQLTNPRAIVIADYNGDGADDVLVTQARGFSPVLFRNRGGNKNSSLRVALKGLADNKTGVGTKLEAFAGTLWQKREVTGSSYLGQSVTTVDIGIGREKQVDMLRLLWPTGVVQDEVNVAAGVAKIDEIDRRGSSCPLLFAWDGSRYRFVADMIGAGVVGHWIGPGQRNAPDPTEYIKVGHVAARGGWLRFRLMEPMEEVVYLDQVRLLAVDHPADVEVYPNEYFASNPPFPEFKVIASHNARPPAGAWDDRGRDVLPVLRERDHRYVTAFELLPYKGFTQPHSLELDLGAPYVSGPLRLLLHGYIEYFTATSMYAAGQAGLTPVAPYVEALDPEGHWEKIVEDMGFPAGLSRTTVADLTGKLPVGTRRIRIGANLQIYWDQILVDRTAPGVPVRTEEVPLAQAKLAFHGYPRPIEGNTPGDLSYIYADVSLTGPYARQAGAYTRLGEVRELLSAADDRHVVFGSGDEVQLEFDPAKLPVLPPGWKRDFFFFADGFEKDMDFYAADGQTVEPLPFHAMPEYPYAPASSPRDASYIHYLLEYNTRFYWGAAESEYRFRYQTLPHDPLKPGASAH
ncbi:MAG: FG-GAP-like repeat-containing protein [Acidobacteriia bacterium]|nr:FG-GAP-like repeat-containing protein [Terriglobia bacterium]